MFIETYTTAPSLSTEPKVYVEVTFPGMPTVWVFSPGDIVDGYVASVNPYSKTTTFMVYVIRGGSGGKKREVVVGALPWGKVPKWRYREGYALKPSPGSKTTPWYDVPPLWAIDGMRNVPEWTPQDDKGGIWDSIKDLFSLGDLFGPETNPFGTLLGDLFGPLGRGGPFDGGGGIGVSGLFDPRRTWGRESSGTPVAYTPGTGSGSSGWSGSSGSSSRDRPDLAGFERVGAGGGAHDSAGQRQGNFGGSHDSAGQHHKQTNRDTSGKSKDKSWTEKGGFQDAGDGTYSTAPYQQLNSGPQRGGMPDPTRNPTGLTGVAFLDDIAMRTARLQGSMISGPTGPALAFGDGEGGGPGVTDVSGVISLDPLAPVAGEIYGGRDPRRPRGYYSGGIDNPYIERLDPDTGSDDGGGGSETVIIQRFLGERPRTPGGEGGDPHARLGGGATVVAVSVGVAAVTKTPR